MLPRAEGSPPKSGRFCVFPVYFQESDLRPLDNAEDNRVLTLEATHLRPHSRFCRLAAAAKSKVAKKTGAKKDDQKQKSENFDLRMPQVEKVKKLKKSRIIRVSGTKKVIFVLRL